MDYWLRQPCVQGNLNLCGGLGDWVPITPTNAGQCSAFYTTLAMGYLSEIGAALGHTESAQMYADQFANASAAYRETFFDPKTGRWDHDSGPLPDKDKIIHCSPSSGRIGGLAAEEGGGTSDAGPMTLECLPGSGTITKVLFANFGEPTLSQDCKTYTVGSCGFNGSQAVVEKACLGKTSCVLHPKASMFGGVDPCPGQVKYLAVVAEGCTAKPTPAPPPFLGSQTSLIMPLALNLAAPPLARGKGPVHAGAELDAAQRGLVAMIERAENHTDSGIIGATFVFDVLNAAGRGDVTLAMLLNDSYPSFGHMIDQGGTTLWENWKGSLPNGAAGSNNHIMFGGGVGTQPYVAFGGISNGRGLSDGRNSSSTAWELIEIRPLPAAIEALPFSSASTHTPRGIVAVRWSRSGNAFALNATVPVGSTADVALPARLGGQQLSAVAEDAVPVWASGTYKPGAAGFKGSRKESAPYGVVVFSVGSGGYSFTATYG